MSEVVFVSCGQRSPEEKELGSTICRMVKDLTPFQPYFAEFQSGLDGLYENIFDSLTHMVGFIAVLHPRGEVLHGTTTAVVRASVWVEQEIAVAAYIRRSTGRNLHTAAFVHSSVELEGLRTLLHLNPVGFRDHNDIYDSLRIKLPAWGPLTIATITDQKVRSDNVGGVSLQVGRSHTIPGLSTFSLAVLLTNRSLRAREYSIVISIPDSVLSHEIATYPSEISRVDAGHRRFRHSEANFAHVPLHRGESMRLFQTDISVAHLKDVERESALGDVITVDAEIGDRLYQVSKTVRELIGGL